MKLEEQDIDRAYFVGGVSGYFRKCSDPRVSDAIAQVNQLFSELPVSLGRPKILSGGLTADPETILDFYWWAGVDDTKHAVTIKIKENGLFYLNMKLSGISDITEQNISRDRLLEVLNRTDALWPFLSDDESVSVPKGPS